MKRKRFAATALAMFVSWSVVTEDTSADAQSTSDATAQHVVTARRSAAPMRSNLSGVFRLDVGRSDKLYAIARSATSRLPAEKQQKVFDDLLLRLSAPDQLAIEQRRQIISIASSRAPRFTFKADGVEQVERASDGSVSRTRAALEGTRLVFTSSGGGSNDRFTITFEPLDDGRSLRVVRRIYAAGLDQPVTIEAIYTKISDAARWDVYGREEESPAMGNDVGNGAVTKEQPGVGSNRNADAATLRRLLAEWIVATNAGDIERQMSYYTEPVAAFYLARNVSRAGVRAEKRRIFIPASKIEIRAEEPEVIFASDGRTAVMRFRKEYVIERGAQRRQGAVVQELRWRQTNGDWKIFSERDMQVIR